jgi:hypothetical protein
VQHLGASDSFMRGQPLGTWRSRTSLTPESVIWKGKCRGPGDAERRGLRQLRALPVGHLERSSAGGGRQLRERPAYAPGK